MRNEIERCTSWAVRCDCAWLRASAGPSFVSVLLRFLQFVFSAKSVHACKITHRKRSVKQRSPVPVRVSLAHPAV